MKGVYLVGNSYNVLLGEGGYKVLFGLPSYRVLTHPKTFHTVLFHVKTNPRDGNSVYKSINQWNIPGLTSDPDITIPAGMWREWAKETVSSSRNRVVVEPPTPTLQRYTTRAIFREDEPTPVDPPMYAPVDAQATLRYGQLMENTHFATTPGAVGGVPQPPEEND